MNGAQCNGPRCGRFQEHPNFGWLFLAQNPAAYDALSPLASLMPGHGPQLAGTFCSYSCVADFSTVAAAAIEEARGVEPQPTGTGWPDPGTYRTQDQHRGDRT